MKTLHEKRIFSCYTVESILREQKTHNDVDNDSPRAIDVEEKDELSEVETQ